MTIGRSWRVGFLSPADDDARHQVFGDLPVEVVTPATRDQIGISDVVRGVDILISDWSGELVPTGDDFRSAPHLCFVQRPGIGVDDHDVGALTEAGIPIANTAGVTGPSMAEWCLGAAISLVRRIGDADRWVRSGEWPQLKLAERGAVDLASLRVGVVGFGPVGRIAAQRFQAIGCSVAYWSRRRRTETESDGVRWLPLDDLLPQSDVLVVAIALTDETQELIDRFRFDLLPQGAFIVNVARGAVLDEAALIEGLADGRLGGAALDVFAEEPLPADSPLRTLDRVILSPHSSANTPQTRARLLTALHENLSRIVSGQPALWVVNGISPTVVRRR